jgi:predicted aspartyl protease
MEVLKLEKVDTLITGTDKKHSSFYLLTFKIGKTKIVSFLDTGCSTSIVSLEAIKNESKKVVENTEVSMTDISGNKTNVELFNISELKLGRRTTVKNINFFAIASLDYLSEALSSLTKKDIKIDCVLGFDLLERLGAVIDFSKSTLTVK